MKLLTLLRAVGASFALVLIGAIGAFAVLPPPATTGPTLGDTTTNLSTVVQAITKAREFGFSGTNSVSQTAGQANCTAIADGSPFYNVTTSAGTGYLCLPTAFGGRMVMIGNTTGNQLNIYGSAATYTAGTQDTINGVVGTTAFAPTPTAASICFTPANGQWRCLSGM